MTTNGARPTGAVVITGASTGIGKSCALALDRRGYRVFAGVRKEADGLALRSAGSERLAPVIIDVTDAATIEAARQLVLRETAAAGLAGLVNNAGIGIGGPLEFIKIDDLRRQLEVNVIGQVAVTQAFLPQLRIARGRVVNMGSIAGRMATPFLGPYAASKFALEAITDSLRMELRPWGINVAIVEPGSIDTPIWDKAAVQTTEVEQALTDEAKALYGGHVDALKGALDNAASHAIPADEVAKAVLHALTAKRPKTRYIVGRDARLQAVAASVLPDRILDRVVISQMGLGKN